jgi:hypothetical protein
MGVKYAVNENFFKAWTPTMAYVLGYWYADGSLENADHLRGRYIRVTSIDETTIIKIRSWLRSGHAITPLQPPASQNGHVRYFLRIGNHTLYDDLVSLGLYPNKSLTIKFPMIPKMFLADFARGYLDGDGCVFLQTAPGKQKLVIIKKLTVIFTSGSRAFLEGLESALRETLMFRPRKIYDGRRAFQLRYSTRQSRILFEFLYGNCPLDAFLKRKFDVFCSYYALRSTIVTPGTSAILNRLREPAT